MPTYVAMWSGPRNISTALMRSFENRSDCFVSDEPFYASFLYKTDFSHPLRDKIIESGNTDYNKIIKYLTGSIPESKKIWYQKHMAHHIFLDADITWIKNITNCFLIRHPSDVIRSYLKKNEIDSVEQLGYIQQIHIYKFLSKNFGIFPIIIDTKDLLQDPQKMLIKVCKILKIKFDTNMLSWPLGFRKTDGIWSQHWYQNVANSTGFKPYIENSSVIPFKYQSIYAQCLEQYELLYQNRIIL